MNMDYTSVKVDAPIVLPEQNCWQVGDCYITAQPTESGLSVANGLAIQSVVCLGDATEEPNPPYLPFNAAEDTTLTVLLFPPQFVSTPPPLSLSEVFPPMPPSLRLSRSPESMLAYSALPTLQVQIV